MEVQNLFDDINACANDDMREFSQKLIFTNKKILGLKSADLKRISKKVLNRLYGDPLMILSSLSDDVYETFAMKGIIIASIKTDDDLKMELIKNHLSKIDNWANCDSFVASLKIIKKEPNRWFNLIVEQIDSGKEFEIRFGIIALMSYYLTDDYIDVAIDIVKNISSDKYYINMAVAWFFATAMIDYYEKVLVILKGKELSAWTHNKTIQKALESYRISDDMKQQLRSLKIKK